MSPIVPTLVHLDLFCPFSMKWNETQNAQTTLFRDPVAVIAATLPFKDNLQTSNRDTTKLAAHSQHCVDSLMRQAIVNAKNSGKQQLKEGAEQQQQHSIQVVWAVAENFGNRCGLLQTWSSTLPHCCIWLGVKPLGVKPLPLFITVQMLYTLCCDSATCVITCTISLQCQSLSLDSPHELAMEQSLCLVFACPHWVQDTIGCEPTGYQPWTILVIGTYIDC